MTNRLTPYSFTSPSPLGVAPLAPDVGAGGAPAAVERGFQEVPLGSYGRDSGVPANAGARAGGVVAARTTPDLRTRARALYETNSAFSAAVQKVMSGDSVENALADLADLLKRREQKAKTHYPTVDGAGRHCPEKAKLAAYYRNVINPALLKEAQEASSLFSEMVSAPGWQRWFATSTAVAHAVSIEFDFRQTIEQSLGIDSEIAWSSCKDGDRRSLVRTMLDQCGAAGYSDRAIDRIACAESVTELAVRLSLARELHVRGKLDLGFAPGDGRLVETNDWMSRGRYDDSQKWLIPERSIVIYRADVRKDVQEADQRRAEGFKGSEYGYRPDGDAVNPSPGSKYEVIVKVLPDGQLQKGAAFEKFFTRAGISLPNRVAKECVPALVHAVDAYLAGGLQSWALELVIEASTKLNATISATTRRA